MKRKAIAWEGEKKTMMVNAIFDSFVQESPITVMLRATMERVFEPERLDELFEATAQKQYTRELLFSTVVGLMGLVACNIRPSVSAAYGERARTLENAIATCVLVDFYRALSNSKGAL